MFTSYLAREAEVGLRDDVALNLVGAASGDEHLRHGQVIADQPAVEVAWRIARAQCVDT
jgi:hypothetical protein